MCVCSGENQFKLVLLDMKKYLISLSKWNAFQILFQEINSVLLVKLCPKVKQGGKKPQTLDQNCMALIFIIS